MTDAKPWREVHVWVPELGFSGGIQNYSRTMVRGLKQLLPDANLRVLSKNDATRPPAGEKITHRICGTVPSQLRTARFAALLLEEAVLRRPDLAILTHLHFAPAAHAFRRLTGLRYWVAVHGLEAWGVKSGLMQRALNGAEKILAVSDYTRRRLIQSGTLDGSRVVLLPNAVDEESFYPAPKPVHLLRRYGLKAEQKIVFTLARLNSSERYKGCDLVLDALCILCDRRPDIHYLLAGAGDDTRRIRRESRQHGLENHVTLTGFLPESDLRDHYNLCDLFVMPSRAEGFGIVYLEALACGRPVVAGNQDGSREPLLGGELGALVDPNDADALAEAIDAALLGPGAPGGPRPSEFLRRRVVERFGFTVFCERLRGLLKS
jgi:glycosyltransferase involved in cell wall biosynthesis